jgi:cell division protein FtsQ
MPKVTKPKKARTTGRAKRGAGENAFSRLAATIENYSIAAFAGGFVLFSLLLFGLWAGGYVGNFGGYLSKSAGDFAVARGLRVEQVTLRGAHNTAHQEILDALGPLIGQSIIHTRIDELRDRVEALGWVRSASVSRLLPDTIHVSVRERTPAAIWQIDGDLKLIDANGAIIRQVTGPEYSQLPFIVGAGAPEAASGILTALAEEEEISYLTYAVVRVGERRWNLRLRNGVDVKLPEVDYAGAIKALSVMQAAHGALDQPLEYIDLRDPERVVIRRRDGSDGSQSTDS